MSPQITPQIPDVREGVAAYLKGKTNAGPRVNDNPQRRPRLPRILIEHDGDIQLSDIRVPRARIVVNSYGNSAEEARYNARQVREAMLPPENVVWGIHTTVSYEDEGGQQQTIHLSGAQLETGPRESASSRTRVITTYLVDYY